MMPASVVPFLGDRATYITGVPVSVNDHDVSLMLRDIGDLIRSEDDPLKRIDLLDSFVQQATDIARDAYLATIYHWRCEGRSSEEIADLVQHSVASVNRWVQEYVDRHLVPRPPRHGAPVSTEPCGFLRRTSAPPSLGSRPVPSPVREHRNLGW